MRYEDWDVLLFPKDSKVPFKEFKVDCHVTHDAEFTHSQGSFGVPTVCCFVPSLLPGEPFQISVHSWTPPSFSQTIRAYPKYQELAIFEARVFIDGRLFASTTFSNEGSPQIWPYVIEHVHGVSKSGDFEPLSFPKFRDELLKQSFWSPADDLGRIKVVISEGFPRQCSLRPVERVKNIVAFSFQHVPATILENSSIAWPNASMWRTTRFTTSMPVPSFPSTIDSHAHSPRRKSRTLKTNPKIRNPDNKSTPNTIPMRLGQPNLQEYLSIGRPPRLFQEEPYLTSRAHRQRNLDLVFDAAMDEPHLQTKLRAPKSNTDISMPDYASQELYEQMLPAEMLGFKCDDNISLRVPSNTPTTDKQQGLFDNRGVPQEVSDQTHDSLLSSLSFPFSNDVGYEAFELSSCFDNSLLNQAISGQFAQYPVAEMPTSEVKSKKPIRSQQRVEEMNADLSFLSTDDGHISSQHQPGFHNLEYNSPSALPGDLSPVGRASCLGREQVATSFGHDSQPNHDDILSSLFNAEPNKEDLERTVKRPRTSPNKSPVKDKATENQDELAAGPHDPTNSNN